MSFIALKGIAEVAEPKAAPEGPYDLVITDAKLTEKDGKHNIRLILGFENTDGKFANIFHYIALPRGEDAGKDQMMLLMAKRFFTQFEIPFDDGVEVESFVGSRARCNVKQDEYEGQIKNVLVLDRLAA